ncbi:MAG: hypothetical protein WAL98_18695, partial [Desulfatiglandaceae bacterium]
PRPRPASKRRRRLEGGRTGCRAGFQSPNEVRRLVLARNAELRGAKGEVRSAKGEGRSAKGGARGENSAPAARRSTAERAD